MVYQGCNRGPVYVVVPRSALYPRLPDYSHAQHAGILYFRAQHAGTLYFLAQHAGLRYFLA